MTTYSIGKTYSPLHRCRLHQHVGWEIILNLSGKGRNLYDGKQHPFCSGSIICIPPGMDHSKIAEDTFEDIFIRSEDLNWFPGDQPFHLEDDEMTSIQKIMEIIHYSYYRDHQIVHGSTTDLIHSLIQMIQERITYPIPDRYSEVLRYRIIQDHADPDFNLKEVMQSLPYCEDYLRTLFKNDFHVTPQEYLTQLRMESACRMLTDGKKRAVAEIAHACGYYDPRYFCRLFKQHTGTTPSEYRQRS